MKINCNIEDGIKMFKEIDKKKALLDSKRPLSSNAIDNLKKYFDVELTYNSHFACINYH